MILLPFHFGLSLRTLNPLGAAKCKRKYLNSETAGCLPNSLACSQYLPSQKTTASKPATSVDCPVSRE